jgi:hypothetical protein
MALLQEPQVDGAELYEHHGHDRDHDGRDHRSASASGSRGELVVSPMTHHGATSSATSQPPPPAGVAGPGEEDGGGLMIDSLGNMAARQQQNRSIAPVFSGSGGNAYHPHHSAGSAGGRGPSSMADYGEQQRQQSSQGQGQSQQIRQSTANKINPMTMVDFPSLQHQEDTSHSKLAQSFQKSSITSQQRLHQPPTLMMKPSWIMSKQNQSNSQQASEPHQRPPGGSREGAIREGRTQEQDVDHEHEEHD